MMATFHKGTEPEEGNFFLPFAVNVQVFLFPLSLLLCSLSPGDNNGKEERSLHKWALFAGFNGKNFGH